MLTTEVLAFKRIVTTATHVLVAIKFPILRLRDLLLDVSKDWRDRLLADGSDLLIASFFHDEDDQYTPHERTHLRGSTMHRLFDLLYSPVLRFALATVPKIEDQLVDSGGCRESPINYSSREVAVHSQFPALDSSSATPFASTFRSPGSLAGIAPVG